jgi:hypothetical protein
MENHQGGRGTAHPDQSGPLGLGFHGLTKKTLSHSSRHPQRQRPPKRRPFHIISSFEKKLLFTMIIRHKDVSFSGNAERLLGTTSANQQETGTDGTPEVV